MSARTERRRDETRLMAVAFNEPDKIDKALPKPLPRRHGVSAKPWWKRGAHA
jgi:hypothetical protein